MNNPLKKPLPALISVVGGECTGKSTLAAALGTALPGVVVGEFLRQWVDEHDGRVPTASEQAAVMQAQHAAEVSALREADRSGPAWVVSDSGPLMTATYSIQYYGDDSLLPRALKWTVHSRWVVWCQDDIEWQPDPQRDGSDARRASQQILADIFTRHPEMPVLPVRGSLDDRVAAVLGAVGRRQRD